MRKNIIGSLGLHDDLDQAFYVFAKYNTDSISYIDNITYDFIYNLCNENNEIKNNIKELIIKRGINDFHFKNNDEKIKTTYYFSKDLINDIFSHFTVDDNTNIYDSLDNISGLYDQCLSTIVTLDSILDFYFYDGSKIQALALNLNGDENNLHFLLSNSLDDDVKKMQLKILYCVIFTHPAVMILTDIKHLKEKFDLTSDQIDKFCNIYADFLAKFTKNFCNDSRMPNLLVGLVHLVVQALGPIYGLEQMVKEQINNGLNLGNHRLKKLCQNILYTTI